MFYREKEISTYISLRKLADICKRVYHHFFKKTKVFHFAEKFCPGHVLGYFYGVFR